MLGLEIQIGVITWFVQQRVVCYLKLLPAVFIVQCTDVWNKVRENVRYSATITYPYLKYLTFQCISYGIFLAPNYWYQLQKLHTSQALVSPLNICCCFAKYFAYFLNKPLLFFLSGC